MTYSQPSAPSAGDKFEAHEHKGYLLLVYPKAFQENIKTTKGLSDAADVDIIVVDKAGPDGRPLVFHGARLFGNLARSVRNDIGGQVLGRLSQITSANGNTPWILENFTPQDASLADPAHQAYQQGLFRPTPNPMAAPAAQAPAQQQWSQQSQAAPAYATPQAPPAYNAAPSPAPAAQQQWNAAPTAAPTAAAPGNNYPPSPAAHAAPPSGAAQPAPSPAAQAPWVDPGLVDALAKRGINLPPGATQADAESIWASLQPPF